MIAQEISERGKENLEQIKGWANSGFLKIQDGQTYVLSFNREQMRTRTIKGFDPKTGDPMNKTVAEFVVVDVNQPNVEMSTSFSKRPTKRITELMGQGHYILKISRKGKGLDTEYTIDPAD